MEYKQYINYSYIVHNKNNRGVMIDPSWDERKIKFVLNQKNIKPLAILLTHEHFDHVNLAEKLAQEFMIPICISNESMRKCVISEENVNIVRTEKKLWFEDICIHPIFTPGHTKGSISYLINDSLFTGDTLFIEGCGMCTDSSASAKDLYVSLKRLVKMIPSSTRIFPGHRYAASLGKSLSYTMMNNIYLKFEREEDFVAFRMRPNQKKLMNFI